MKEVYNYLTKDIKIKNSDVIVIGCSGGPDSMALMHVLLELRKNRDILIICAHVNHNVRKESRDEEKFLQEYCEKNSIIFESMTILEYGDDNFHNEARKIRYHFFEETIRKYNANYLMTAHHGDDLVETILMRIVRGSTLKGYAGFERKIEKDNYTILRPLVFVTKGQLEKYNIENNIPYVTDKSNFKDKYTRNRYRKKVLPFLKQEEPNVHYKFLKFSDTLIEYSDYIDKVIEREFKKVYIGQKIKISALLLNDDLIQKKIIFKILEEIYNDDLNSINMTHVMAIIKLIKSNKANGFINLPGNFKVIKEYDQISITKKVNDISMYEIEIDEFVELPHNRKISVVEDAEKNDNNVCRLLTSEISMPLYVRTRKLGDKMVLKKIDGKQKVKNIFIDKKIPLLNRDDWPIVVDSNDNILWIPGIKKSKFSKQKNEKYDIILKYDD